ESLTDDQLEDRLERAADRYRSFRHTSMEKRAGWMRRAAGILESDK
ncbi:MAG: hypothetical protein GWM90_03210, partial [Gemmatimonadetes bacterium]|nr:hypothetical protein [Gemmatimonadota bacterium]NIQ52626.1 hypothetical protein [Gemmatimonadota bacterium]NIU72761.1 hypothetical protein [Gammaproteobacteria bacterium]NIX43164.1 hypothetical protein [Gemmatimonadota bacterium]NIY07330.1 hypothetical protein [Gemmatimonadota bacterium]